MARSLPKVCPFLVTVDLKLKWPEFTPPYLMVSDQTLEPGGVGTRLHISLT